LMVATAPEKTAELTQVAVAPPSTSIRHRLPRLSELSPRQDVPPL
jgi:hypothetical protein